MKCTWKDCKDEATKQQLDKNGEEWANLCQDHHEILEDHLESLEPKRILGAWVKASGGADKMAKKIFNR